MEFVQLKFKVLKLIFSLITSALVAWILVAAADANWIVVFLVLAIGFPLAVWLERLKNVPAHLLSAYLMNKELVSQTKKKLKKLPLKTADEWNDFQAFYDNDQAIAEHVTSDPKTYVAITRYSIQTLRDTGNFMDFVNSGLVSSKAIEEVYWETTDKENTEN